MSGISLNRLVNVVIIIYLCLIYSEVWIRFLEHEIVRRELDQLLTYTAGNAILAQISINALKGIDNILIIVKLRFVCRTFVDVKKQFVLNILSLFFCILLYCKQGRIIF